MVIDVDERAGRRARLIDQALRTTRIRAIGQQHQFEASVQPRERGVTLDARKELE
jgi:hypothetical protein